MQTTTPSSSSSASRRATWTTAPEETPGEDRLLVDQRAHAGERLLVRDEQLPVELRDVEDRRDVAVLERAEAHHGVARQRLGGGDDDVREGLANALAGAHQRAAGAEARDEHVDRSSASAISAPVPS